MGNWVVVSFIFFIFTPNFGEDEPILTNFHILQMGWFNHHLVNQPTSLNRHQSMGWDVAGQIDPNKFASVSVVQRREDGHSVTLASSC